MMDELLAAIGAVYPLTERDPGEFGNAKVAPMKFAIRSYTAAGLGNVSVMTGKAMGGLMVMDTLVVNPFEKDMALFSYDRIHAMGNDTLFLEIYDTRLDRTEVAGDLAGIVKNYEDLPDDPVAPNWYDDIKWPESVKKKGKKKQSARFDELTKRYFAEYLRLCRDAAACDPAEKKKAAAVYTEGLLSNGGPSTDQFVKAKGKEYTAKLFREVLFGTGEQ